MFISLKELELRSVAFSVAVAAGEIEFLDGLRQVGLLEAAGKAELQNAALEEIRVRGRLRTGMDGECDRCLDPARFAVEGEFDLRYRPARFAITAARDEVEIHGSESEIAFYDGEGIELNDVLREFVVLSLPMRKLCRGDCRGICPVCGRNRNASDCGCEAKPADDRWAALKQIR